MEERIILGFVGAFGSGCTYIAKKFIEPKGYHYISLSDILRELYHEDEEQHLSEKRDLVQTERIILQDFGDEVRHVKGTDFLARKALERIEENHWNRVVIDSFRNPKEIEYLKIHCIKFFLFGIFSDIDIRWKRVKDKYSNNKSVFEKDERRDKGNGIEYGQRVTECFLLADVIVSNNEDIRGENDAWDCMRTKIEKYMSLLIDGAKGKLPSQVESVMAMAYANSLRSSCLKRKVGAVIIDSLGNTFSSGYNEVPPLEKSCKNMYGQCCRNDCKNEIAESLKKENVLEPGIRNITKKIKILEKCRALHAEENAILNIAKLFYRYILITGL